MDLLGSLEEAEGLEEEPARSSAGTSLRRVERTEAPRPTVKPVTRIVGAIAGFRSETRWQEGKSLEFVEFSRLLK